LNVAPSPLRGVMHAWNAMSDFQRAALLLGGLAVWFLFRITRLLGRRPRIPFGRGNWAAGADTQD